MKLIIAFVVLLNLSGCAAVVLGSAAVGAVTVSEDKRSVSTQIDDARHISKIENAWQTTPAISEGSHINVHVYNGVALLTGQTLNPNIKAEAEKLAKQATQLTAIHNRVRIAKPTATSTRAHDLWLASKVKSQLIASDEVNPLRLDVIIEDSEVFLMGLVSAEEARGAVSIARHVSGVTRVYNIMEVSP